MIIYAGNRLHVNAPSVTADVAGERQRWLNPDASSADIGMVIGWLPK